MSSQDHETFFLFLESSPERKIDQFKPSNLRNRYLDSIYNEYL